MMLEIKGLIRNKDRGDQMRSYASVRYFSAHVRPELLMQP